MLDSESSRSEYFAQLPSGNAKTLKIPNDKSTMPVIPSSAFDTF
jgi:hypothetical protein